MNQNEEYLTKQEAADQVKVSIWTVSAWLTQGRLRRTRAGGRCLIARSDLDAFIRDSTAAPSIVGRRRGKRTSAQKSA